MGARLFVGIDLGTTNTTCTVGAWDGKGRPEIRRLAIRQLTDDPAGAAPYGDRAMLPSAVCLTEDGKAYTGEHCKAAGADLARAAGGKVVRSVKLQMGNLAWSVQAAGRVYHPRHVSALILKTVHASLRRAYPGAEVEKVTVTIPASFSSRMRQETLRAAELAGFDPGALQLLDEPVAALFSTWDPAADAFPGLPARCNVLVFDMGGGTLDVSVLQVSSEEREVTVLATSRYNEVAGNDLDLEIAALLLQKARGHRDYNKFLEYDPGRPDDDGLRRQIGLGLMETAERVKLDLGQLLEDEEGPADLLHYIRHYADGGKAVRAELDLEFGARAAPRVVDLPVSELLECVEPLLTLGRRRRDDDRNIFVPVEQALRRANRK
jgi:molecular chaperone DnaK